MEERQWRLLVRYFSGEASTAEEQEVRRWMQTDPANLEEVKALRSLWDASGVLPNGPDEDAAWAKVMERTGLAPSARSPLHAPPAPRSTRRPRAIWQGPLLRVAAMLVLLAGSLLVWRPASRAFSEHVLQRTVTTGKGERVQLVLADGSRVLLGVESRLRYPRRFRGDRRDVHLEGVAYFEVARDPRRPFSVYTADAVTRVLGTKFTVRNYRGSEPVRVAVAEGKVAVRPAASPAGDASATTLLRGGEAVELALGRVRAVVDPVDERRDLAWTRGTIAFTNAPVPEVLTEIGRWYDVSVRVTDPTLAARHLTISFENEPLDMLLREIAAALGARLVRHEEGFLLAPASTARPVRPSTEARYTTR